MMRFPHESVSVFTLHQMMLPIAISYIDTKKKINSYINQKTVTGSAASSDTFKVVRSGEPVKDVFVSEVPKDV